jgi:hypothetical protein
MSGTAFGMRGFKGRTIPSAHSATPLEIKGAWTMQGPQVVGGEGGVPEWVFDLFQANPHLEQIALGYERGGVLYHRPSGLEVAREVAE